MAVAIGGTPVYRKGFGLASMELPVLLSPTMRMRIGSTTKHFACLAFMLLCEDGLASIEDPVEKYVPEVHPVAHGVTMRQLMGHTSGLRDMLSVTMFSNGTGAPVSDAQMVEYYRTIDDVDFAPQTDWSYNNGAYMLLTAAIERLSEQPLETVLRDRIFLPIGMNDTLLRRWDTDFVGNSAMLHMIDGKGGFTRDHMGMEITGAGGMASTMDDMLLWLKHMDAPFVGTAETWKLMREPQTLTNGTITGYGFGLMTVPYRGVTTVQHGGGVIGGNSQMIKVPSAGLDISVAVNRADASAADLSNQIIDLMVEGLTPEPEKSEAEPVEGLYVSPTSGRVVELVANDGMQLFSYDGAPGLPVQPDEEGVLQVPPAMRFMQTSFAPGDGAGTFHEFGKSDIMERVEPDPGAALGERTGVYRAEGIGARATITEGEEGPRLFVEGRHGKACYTLAPLNGSIWRATAMGAFSMLAGAVTFAPDAKSFEITFTRMRHLRFTRV
ncbi:beta-lactamase family protein [Novosphingobium sp. 1949]|uniref:Beta-lactamase family protein n=1 Tax=Novosphingobium organovorum TaxID=2930092 RepID=A0ABT0BGA8_9SPHN|nr:beta-lactamase family protein [Novosphingobium organovorum]